MEPSALCNRRQSLQTAPVSGYEAFLYCVATVQWIHFPHQGLITRKIANLEINLSSFIPLVNTRNVMLHGVWCQSGPTFSLLLLDKMAWFPMEMSWPKAIVFSNLRSVSRISAPGENLVGHRPLFLTLRCII